MSEYKKRTLFIWAAIALAAVLLGKYVVVPLTPALGTPWRILIGGLSLLALIWAGVSALTGCRINRYWENVIRMSFPKDVEAIRAMGVKNNLDFAYAMTRLMSYVPVRLFGNTVGIPRAYYNHRIYKKSIELFEQMFGRKPVGIRSLDWGYIAASEAAMEMNSEPGKIPFELFEKKISKEVRRYFDRDEYLHDSAV